MIAARETTVIIATDVRCAVVQGVPHRVIAGPEATARGFATAFENVFPEYMLDCSSWYRNEEGDVICPVVRK